MSSVPPEIPPDVRAQLDVSRETWERLALYLDLLVRWNRAINLVGRSTLADPWRRHILDSAQLRAHIPRKAEKFVDLGSGAGLPGLVLAILGCAHIHLVEADARKAQFLREAARATGTTNVSVECRRIETLAMEADVVTARALAPLPRLLALAAPLLSPRTICLFLKGRSAREELTEALQDWTMTSDLRPSLSDPDGRIIVLTRICRRHERAL